MRKRIWGPILAFLLALSVASCGAFMPPVADVIEIQAVVEDPVIELAPNLSVDEVAQVMSQTEVVVVDVREDWEFNSGHIPDAVLIPVAEIADRVDEIPTDVPVVLVCRSGNRSSQAYRYLKQQGFENIHNMLGGMLDWSESGYEVVQ